MVKKRKKTRRSQMLTVLRRESKGRGLKPKFKVGDFVSDRDDSTRNGLVAFNGEYDSYLGGYRYRVLELDGRRHYWNESSMVRG
jgi:hypothetical protein